MRNLLLLVLIIVVALVIWNRSKHPTQEVQLRRLGSEATASSAGGPVRHWEREPNDMTEREGTLPQPGSGVAPNALLDSVRHGLQRSGQP
jgi:hypothetical protein